MSLPPTPRESPTWSAISPPAVSIVVPIRNAEEYLGACLGSLRGQSLTDIEILCYDDASTDGSLEIARAHAAQDERIRLVCYPETRSSSQARKDGVLAATGEYLMFVDADDFLDPTACEELVRRMRKLKVDILQFGTTIINTGNAERARLKNLERLLAPLEEHLAGRAPFEECFIRTRYGHSLWNKIYRMSFAKRAFSDIPDGSYPKGQDLLAYFVLAWHATSYAGIPHRYYNYRFGAGITGAATMTLDRLRIYATQSLVAEAVDAFAAGRGNSPELLIAARGVRQRLAADCVMQWYRNMPAKLAAEGFDLLTRAWSMAELTDALQRSLPDDQGGVAAKLGRASLLSPQHAPIAAGSTIGLYYHRLTIGGLPRVVILLAQLYLDMGFRVVVMLDEEHPGEEFPLPAEVVRVQLPAVGENGYAERARGLEGAIANHRIDAVVYFAASSPNLLWDLLTVKAKGVPFLISIHDSAFHSLLNGTPGLATRPKVVRLADAVQVLSKAEETFWRSQGARAVYLPNPVTPGIVDESELDPQPGNLLWVGRLDTWVKQCLELPKIMAVVRRSHPEARLHVVGGEWSPGVRKKLERQIQRAGLEENLIICGPTFDIEQYYRRASVLLLTSVTECFPMTIVEARAYGVPVAMYRLPHLAMLADGLGFVDVPQGDATELGLAVSELLDDDDRRRRLGAEGRQGLASFAETDLAQLWRELFIRATDPDSADYAEPVDIETVGALLSNALDIYLVGLRRREGRLASLRARTERAERDLRRSGAAPLLGAVRRLSGAARTIRRKLTSLGSRKQSGNAGSRSTRPDPRS
jgi:glycosyltransferase involved in cell wall biosynthesis